MKSTAKSIDLSGFHWKNVHGIDNTVLVESLILTKNGLRTNDISSLPILARLQSLDLSQNELDSNLQLAEVFMKFPQLRVSVEIE